ncbi:hypothetical protein BS78_K254700 [Paspalum vaginatum]|uniref:Uncharacterized protein n=1 Tax=Paspalum vaginatum TaxID=158149 RepID=A0A9W7X8N1_9POAL|nr:hypothetical protein BS78_K254700 [Paspalum vaginatum]KAJ1255360.1 hypothetical protein BS78_K254700 [Paspalum vaginatum]
MDHAESPSTSTSAALSILIIAPCGLRPAFFIPVTASTFWCARRFANRAARPEYIGSPRPVKPRPMAQQPQTAATSHATTASHRRGRPSIVERLALLEICTSGVQIDLFALHKS